MLPVLRSLTLRHKGGYVSQLPSATWYFGCLPLIREQAQGSACQRPMAIVPEAGAGLPPLCRRLLFFKFHRLLHDMSALCLLRIQDGVQMSGRAQTRDGRRPFLISSGPCTPGPCAYSRVWSLDTLRHCGLAHVPGGNRSSGNTRLYQVLHLTQTCNQSPVPLQEGSARLPSCVVLCVCSCVVHNLSPSLFSPIPRVPVSVTVSALESSVLASPQGHLPPQGTEVAGVPLSTGHWHSRRWWFS